VAAAARVDRTAAMIAPCPAVFGFALFAGLSRPGRRNRCRFNQGLGLKPEPRIDDFVGQSALPGNQDIAHEASVILAGQGRTGEADRQGGGAQSGQEMRGTKHGYSLELDPYMR
jgi:hypothetical protein